MKFLLMNNNFRKIYKLRLINCKIYMNKRKKLKAYYNN